MKYQKSVNANARFYLKISTVVFSPLALGLWIGYIYIELYNAHVAYKMHSAGERRSTSFALCSLYHRV